MNKEHSGIVTGKRQPTNPALTAFEMSPAFAVKCQRLNIHSSGSTVAKYRAVPGLNRRNRASGYSTNSVHKCIQESEPFLRK
jgi:hypothetical protein